MSHKRIEFDLDLSYNDLDNVIEGLQQLRELHGKGCTLEIEMEPILYDDDNRETIGYYLILPQGDQ